MQNNNSLPVRGNCNEVHIRCFFFILFDVHLKWNQTIPSRQRKPTKILESFCILQIKSWDTHFLAYNRQHIIISQRLLFKISSFIHHHIYLPYKHAAHRQNRQQTINENNTCSPFSILHIQYETPWSYIFTMQAYTKQQNSCVWLCRFIEWMKNFLISSNRIIYLKKRQYYGWTNSLDSSVSLVCWSNWKCCVDVCVLSGLSSRSYSYTHNILIKSKQLPMRTLNHKN